MMRIALKKMITVLAAVSCMLAFTAVAAAMSFSADLYSSDGHNGRFYLSADKTRLETAEMITIVRMDRKLVWMLMPEDRQYMEHMYNPANIRQSQVPAAEPAADEIERVFILREKINGYVADKYRITVKKQGSHYEWLSSDPGIMMAVRTAAIDGSWWHEYRNISLATPDPALFEIPPGYTKISMPGMGGMFMPQ